MMIILPWGRRRKLTINCHANMLLNSETVLRGDLVCLIPYKEQHVERYHSWMTDPELQELTESEPLSLEQEYEMQESWMRDDDKLTFIIVAAEVYENDEVGDDVESMVGDVNCFFNDPEDRLQRVEIEVMIAEKAYRRRGFGREALQLMMRYCVKELGVKGFRAQILEVNRASRSLFESLGFELTRRIEVFNEVVYEIGGAGEAWEISS
jgi:RimJ/RimL family protein N-acetyltransferase